MRYSEHRSGDQQSIDVEGHVSELCPIQLILPCGNVWFLLDVPVISKKISEVLLWFNRPQGNRAKAGACDPEIRRPANFSFRQTRRMTRQAVSEPEGDDSPPEFPAGCAGSESGHTECRAALDEMSAEAERLGLQY